MPFCASCGAPVEGRFCGKCGSSATTGAPPAGSVQQPLTVDAGGMADNVASLLCYVLGFITGILFLVLSPYNKNRLVRFHAFQSIFLSVAVICIRVVLSMFLFTALHLYSFLFINSIISLAFFALWIFMMVTAYQGKKIVLPLIGPFAEQQA